MYRVNQTTAASKGCEAGKLHDARSTNQGGLLYKYRRPLLPLTQGVTHQYSGEGIGKATEPSSLLQQNSAQIPSLFLLCLVESSITLLVRGGRRRNDTFCKNFKVLTATNGSNKEMEIESITTAAVNSMAHVHVWPSAQLFLYL